eukprot:TRINITY_DN14911_c0_g1_i1.p2 TRINITY_DN14911_c0_g1~~TRINITY_DN14911_c0_g1_i1.p2  ORF type:complete len:186 (-),score=15.68 TRINITY_DN14911_c0_g1_i1:287-793(-)
MPLLGFAFKKDTGDTRINLRRKLSDEPLYHEIVDGYYVGGWPPSPDVLPPDANLAVIDCTCEFDRTHDRPYLCLPTWDTEGVSPSHVKAGVDFAMHQRRLGRSVLVHCAHGHGRSVEVLMACLVIGGIFKTYEEALTAARSKRPKCKLNAAQRRNLEQYLASARVLSH